MNGTEVFVRTPAYERELTQIRLRPPAWKLLLALDGSRTVSEVSQDIDMPLLEIEPLTEEFSKKGWVEEQALSLDEYLKSNGNSTFAIPPQEVLDLPPAPSPPVIPAPAPLVKEPPLVLAASAPQPPISFPPLPKAIPVATEKTRQSLPPVLLPPKIISAPAAKKSASFILAPKVPVQIDPAPAPRKKQKLKLQAVVDFLVAQGETKILGQLLVYRAFVRIPSELLDNANLAAIQLLNDPSLVEDEPLQKAIIRAVEETVDASLPNSVFVSV